MTHRRRTTFTVQRPIRPSTGNLQRAIGRRGTSALAVGVAGLLGVFWLLTHADRLPGPAGAAIRHNVETGRGTGLFYTDVDDWLQLVKRVERRLNRVVGP